MDAVCHGFQSAAWGGQPVLLDVTRLVALRWTGRQANGIDRVCLAYLHHFGPRARAVVQHRGLIRVLSPTASNSLFKCLAEHRRIGARSRLLAILASALPQARQVQPGSLYLNVSHTDYDLPTHTRWIAHHDLRAIYLLHDLIPILHPEHCRPHAVTRHTGRVRSALLHGAGIIVGSGAVARDLSHYAEQLQLPCPPVTVAPLAGAALRGQVTRQADDSDYFLCVGTIESRKNHRLLVKVWQRMHAAMGRAAPRLVIVGRWGTGVATLRETLAASGMVDGLIEIVEDCSDDALATLMLGARAMLMPSLAEGFGLPMAEALSLGVPVIASDLPCFHEVGQGIPCLLDPHDVAAWEARIVALDPAASRRQRRIDALRGYCPPSWQEHFEQVEPWMASIAHTPFAASRQAWSHPVGGGHHIDLGTRN